MSWLKSIAKGKITSDRLDLWMVRAVCFAVAPALLFFGFRAVARFATTPAEAATGLLAASLLFIVAGLLMPLVSPAWRQHQGQRQGAK
jgi:hypothetical protein